MRAEGEKKQKTKLTHPSMITNEMKKTIYNTHDTYINDTITRQHTNQCSYS